jgi:hypothetical protein
MFLLWSWSPCTIVGCCYVYFFCGCDCLTPLFVAINVHASFVVMVALYHCFLLLLLFVFPSCSWSLNVIDGYCSFRAIDYCKHHHNFFKYLRMLLLFVFFHGHVCLVLKLPIACSMNDKVIHHFPTLCKCGTLDGWKHITVVHFGQENVFIF